MTKQQLDNLVKIGQLKLEPGTRAEFNGMVDSATKRLADARNENPPYAACVFVDDTGREYLEGTYVAAITSTVKVRHVRRDDPRPPRVSVEVLALSLPKHA